ncbi:hypothetical protein PFICI_12872 [Pestalotiopsis fici W106-1]|uniref:Transcription factor domain-containing protein n=1 Tax=Pestalotiopsis fici (strain W106-1 / CGMCC3.15140) TaxID=1229662 RepID=W3WPY8_PESFW|nr:uncharacterized protein PFICI_12872 [Pestalotiopsis fici W106-1]ETS75928.1 hypothetical protein PFICI_12872 [Pestalotiopsis fici W106-1]
MPVLLFGSSGRDTESPTRSTADSRESQDRQLQQSLCAEIGDATALTVYSLMPAGDVLADAVDSYFHYCHMQPLWLFDREEFSSIQDCREETLFSLLALSSCHSRHPFFHGRSDELSQTYAQAARERIMRQIGIGNVSLSTIQSLCLLALANLQANNQVLLRLHVGIATTLAKCANLDFETNHLTEVESRTESHRRLFWSLHLLQQKYGQQSSATNILEDVTRPQFVATHSNLGEKLNELCPHMPQEEMMPQHIRLNSITKSSGIWAYMIQLSTLWGEVRTYVNQWAQQNNCAPAPWSIESGYAIISAHLMDLETKLPAHHRFDSARFPDQENRQLQNDREYWSPWLYLQFTYHTIHGMLNHPFLYSSWSRHSARLAVPNTFWKTSSEHAFVHSTWVARLIDMVTNKEYRVSDPFIGHCTAIAATIHIYFCRAADRTTREAALGRLTRCIAFLAELALRWPSCRWMHEKLQALVGSAFALDSQRAKEQEDPTPRTLSINTRSMWDILLYNLAANRSSTTLPQPGGLFDASYSVSENNIDEGEDIVEMEISHSPTVEVVLSNGQALPPQSGKRRNPVNSEGIRVEHASQARPDVHSPFPAAPVSDLDAHFVQPTPHAPWPMSGNSSNLDMTYDSFFQSQVPGSPFFGTWEVGNL